MPVSNISPAEEALMDKPGSSSGIEYPSPFFDLAQTYFPKCVKDLFKYCIYFYNTNCIVPAIVNKLASYPITSLVYATAGDKPLQKKWKDLLEKRLNLPFLMYEIGIDMGVYGNSFLGIYLPFTRYLVCPLCHSATPMKAVADKKIKIKNMQVSGVCPSCGKAVDFDINDRYIKTMEGINIIRYDPMTIEILADPVSGERSYIWSPPEEYKEALKEGKDLDLYERAPKIVLDCLKEDKRIVLKKDLFYHMRRPSLAGQCSSWGYPLIMHALKSLYYLQTLKRAQEAIAVQHIIPLWVLFPQASNSSALPPAASIGLGRWKAKVEEELRKWRKDPNYIPIMNIPMGIQHIGGEGRNLLLAPEVQQEVQQIVASMSVPQEFVFGGLTWTGSSITLRMLENTFQGTRDGLQKFIDFLVTKLSKYLGYSSIDIYMAELKMADDIQRQQIAMNLEATGKISGTRLLAEFGYDYLEEEKLKKEEAAKKLINFTRESAIQAKAQGEGSLINLDYQIKGQKKQIEAEGEMMVLQSKTQSKAQSELAKLGLNPPPPVDENGNPIAPPPEQGGPTPQGPQEGQGEMLPQEGNIDPQTGLPIDPNSGLPYDPQSGILIDLQAGVGIDPNGPIFIDLQTGQQISQEEYAARAQNTSLAPQDGAQGEAGTSLQGSAPMGDYPETSLAQAVSPENAAALQNLLDNPLPEQMIGNSPVMQTANAAALKDNIVKTGSVENVFDTPRRHDQEARATQALRGEQMGYIPPNIKRLVTNFATDLNAMDVAAQQEALTAMQQEMPTLASLVKQRLSNITEIQQPIKQPTTKNLESPMKTTKFTKKRIDQ